MTKITEVVHFMEQKISSILTIDDFAPNRKKERFLREGGFFLRVADGEGNSQTIRLSDTEMTNLIADVNVALEEHRREKLRLYAEIEKRERASEK